MSDNLVTVASFSEPLQAHLASTKLEAEGIECCISDENIVGMYWLYSQAVGGVKLQVREKDVERARLMLQLPQEQKDAVVEKEEIQQKESGTCCPKCSSEEIEYEKYSKKAFYLTILFLGFPALFRKDRYGCNSCGHKWK
jgi:hypothetical protein